MMAFFFTMPISRMTPISAIRLNSVLRDQQRQHRADAGRRQRRQDRQRMDVALIENAQHDIDREDRGQDQQRLARRAIAGRAAPCPRNAPWTEIGTWIVAPSCAGSPPSPGRAKRPWRRLNENVVDDERPLMVDRQRRRARAEARERRQRHHRLDCAVLTEAPVEAPPRALLVSALSCWLRTASPRDRRRAVARRLSPSDRRAGDRAGRLPCR